MEPNWVDILERQPMQRERVLIKTLGSQVRIVTYDRWDFAHWSATHWKPMPKESNLKAVN